MASPTSAYGVQDSGQRSFNMNVSMNLSKRD